MSERTLTRRLSEEGVTFNEILQQLKASLAIRYLVLLSQSAAAFVDRNHIVEKTHFSAWGG
jgi:hypothetical protein